MEQNLSIGELKWENTWVQRVCLDPWINSLLLMFQDSDLLSGLNGHAISEGTYVFRILPHLYCKYKHMAVKPMIELSQYVFARREVVIISIENGKHLAVYISS